MWLYVCQPYALLLRIRLSLTSFYKKRQKFRVNFKHLIFYSWCKASSLSCVLLSFFYISFSTGHIRVQVRRAHDRHIPHINLYINALPIINSWPLWGRLHGSRLHRPSPSSYSSAVVKPSPPATMTHPPIDAHARPHRGSCIGGNGDQRAPSASMVSAAHDEASVPLAS